MAEDTRIGLGRQISLQHQMEVLANNIANVDTTGFKTQHILFSELITPHKGAKTVQTGNTYRDLSQGALKPTYNELDFSIQGSGFFAIQMPDGTTKYTRNGSFALNDAGELVTKSSGYPVLTDNGNTITVPKGTTQIAADITGKLTSNGNTLGTLKLVTFDDQQAMTPSGNSLIDAHDAPEQPVDKPHVVQGMLESSNVNAIVEMAAMNKILDAYKSAHSQQSTDHQRAESMIKILTKLET